jgi:hypothetical protein
VIIHPITPITQPPSPSIKPSSSISDNETNALS